MSNEQTVVSNPNTIFPARRNRILLLEKKEKKKKKKGKEKSPNRHRRVSAREDSLDSRPGTCRLVRIKIHSRRLDSMHLARLHTHPFLIVKQSSRISSQISVKCPFLSLFLNPGFGFRFSDVSFLRFWMEGNTRAAVIGESPTTPLFSNPRIRHESVVFVSLLSPLSRLSLSLSLDLEPLFHPKCLCSTISWLAISRYPLCSCLLRLCIPSIFRGLYPRILSLSLSPSVSLSLLAIQWNRWLSHCSTSRIKRISDDSRFHLGLNVPMGG